MAIVFWPFGLTLLGEIDTTSPFILEVALAALVTETILAPCMREIEPEVSDVSVPDATTTVPEVMEVIVSGALFCDNTATRPAMVEVMVDEPAST